MKNLELLNNELKNSIAELIGSLIKRKLDVSKKVLNEMRKIQKLYNESMKISEKRFSELVHRSPVPIAIYEAVNNGDDFVFVEFNPAAEKVEKIKKKDLLGKKVTKVFPGVKEFGLLSVFKEVWETGKARHYPLKIYKGDRMPVTKKMMCLNSLRVV